MFDFQVMAKKQKLVATAEFADPDLDPPLAMAFKELKAAVPKNIGEVNIQDFDKHIKLVLQKTQQEVHKVSCITCIP